uniref:D-aminoacyl-tRNA deacylase n=1 Tax=Macrostomum lignano TaxID=282301 RepID=A0A1I8FMA2_9PLAT
AACEPSCSESAELLLWLNGATVGEIGRGICVLLGICQSDTAQDADWMSKKLLNLRLFDENDEQGATRPDFRRAMSHRPGEKMYADILEYRCRRDYQRRTKSKPESFSRHDGSQQHQLWPGPFDVLAERWFPNNAAAGSAASEELTDPTRNLKEKQWSLYMPATCLPTLADLAM